MTMILSSSSERNAAAFNLLAVIVRQWYAEGKRAYGASLKPELQVRTAKDFDEKRLGYMTFKQFLQAAVEQGLVDIYPAPNSPDVHVVPKGEEPTGLGMRRSGGQTPHIPKVRQDLWKAFIDWSPEFERFYDRTENVAYTIPASQSSFESPEVTRLRKERLSNPARFVPISPISHEVQLDWMRNFASEQPPEVRLGLMQALAEDRPTREFSVAVRRTPDVGIRWQGRRLVGVKNAIEQWKAANRVVVDIHSPVRASGGHAFRSPEPASRLELDEKRLRAQIHAAIDEMSVSELLDIPVRLRYVVNVGR
jgi:hypothetical protein